MTTEYRVVPQKIPLTTTEYEKPSQNPPRKLLHAASWNQHLGAGHPGLWKL